MNKPKSWIEINRDKYITDISDNNNDIPFKIARYNPTEEYQQILPKMNENIGDSVYNQLDKHHIGSFDGSSPPITC